MAATLNSTHSTATTASASFGRRVLAVAIGLGLTALFGNRLLTGYPRGLVVGLVYGAIWWVLGLVAVRVLVSRR